MFLSPTLGLHTLREMEINPGNVLLWVIGIVAGLIVLWKIIAYVFRGKKIVRKVQAWLQKFWEEFFSAYNLMIRHGKMRFVANVLIAGIQWIIRYSIVPLLLYSLGQEVNFLQFFILYWLLASLASFIPTPGATGAAEGAFLLVFSTFIPSAMLGLVMIGWRFLSFYLLNIAGIVVVMILEIQSRPDSTPSTEETELADVKTI